MTEQEIIKALQENERPFGLMDKELRDKVMSIPARFLECLTIESTRDSPIWNQCKDGGIDWEDGQNIISTFRLNSDYSEEPETIKCKIDWTGAQAVYTYNGALYYLSHATGRANHAGFLYEDGVTRAYLPAYKYKENRAIIDVANNIEDYTILRPTHVVLEEK